MIKLVTFGSKDYTISRERCANSAKNFGCEYAYIFDQHHIGDDFFLLNADIFKHSRGFGFWLWKPYFIYKAMLHSKEGDIICYSDAGIEFVGDVKYVIDRMDQDIYFFSNGWHHIHWCKTDVINRINGCQDMEGYGERKQVQASNIFFRVNEKTRAFVKEWLLYCQMAGLIDDSPSKLQNHPEFQEHRHDQAILTALQIRYGYRLHWFPSTTGMHLERTTDELYPPIFLHHRKKDNEY